MTSTPKFGKPPVIETVLGVQFEPLRSMRLTHFGLFWELIKDEFPDVEHHPMLEPLMESFDDPPLPSRPVWKVMGEAELPRAWFLSKETEEGQRLVQLQVDRLIYNWRRASLSAQQYPSYNKNRGDFDRTLRRFLDFVTRHELGTVKPNQCEVTYVNHIPLDDGLTAGGMARRCFPVLSGLPSDRYLPASCERVAYKSGYQISDKRGRLHIEVESPVEKRTRQVILRLALTARGAPDPPEVGGVLSWLDLVGHPWVVNGFKSFTSEEMHGRWELVQR